MVSAPRLGRRRIMFGCVLGTVAWLMAASAGAADFYAAPGDKVVGKLQEYVIQQGDVLADIARKFDIGYTEMLAANPGVQPWSPRVGSTVTIPSLYILPDGPRRGIVMNLGARRLYYFPPKGPMQTYPIGIGAIGFDTPHTTTRVVRKEPNPIWVPTASIRDEEPGLPASIGPGPDNPLGAFALRLGWNNYLIHGTNKPDGVGRNVSHGCIHLYPEDIEKLFNSVAVGTPVRVIEQEADIAWMGIGLYIEAHPSKTQADTIDTEQPMTPEPLSGLREQVSAAAGDYAQAIDWNAVAEAASQRTGLPIQVAMRPPGGEMSAAQPAPQSAPASAPSLTEGPAPVFQMLRPPPESGATAPPDAVGNVNQPVADNADNDSDRAPISLLPQDMSRQTPGDGVYVPDTDPGRPAWSRPFR